MESATTGTVNTNGSLARSIIWATLVSSAVLIGGSTLAVWMAQGKAGEGLAIGLFCAVWGGPGFGAMFGAGLHTLRTERRAAAPAVATAPALSRTPPAAIPLPPVPESRAWTV